MDFDFINRTNADYIDRLYQQYRTDPRSLEPQWLAFFAGFEAGSTRPSETTRKALGDKLSDIPLSVELSDLVHSYRELGHTVAKLDPLGHDRPNHPLLELSEF